MLSSAVSAELIVRVAEIYAGVGLIFGLMFVWRGAARVDPAVRGSSGLFRLLILPGAIALWPMLLARWRWSRTGGQT